MDDLFRKAAARYPLKAGDSDWESIAEKIKPAGKPPAGSKPYGSRKMLSFLFIIPVAFLFHNSFETPAGRTQTTSQPSITQQVLKSVPATGRPLVEISSVKKEIAVPISNNNKVFLQEDIRELKAAVPKLAATTPGTNNPIRLPKDAFTQPPPSPPQISKMPRAAKTGFYFGLSGGIDLGTVKGQSFTKAGYELGLIAGYRINKHLSVESGVSFIQKKYYTVGKHFDMKKIESSMPGGMEMTEVKGRLSLLEIPYKLKYDFLLKERSNFFIAAGGSSNIYLKESNEYHTSLNGVSQQMQATYTDIHCAPLCLVHLSAGYEQHLKNQNRIRFEPYVKFPLRKVGMGSVPLLSIGLNVSVSNFTGR